MARQAQGFFFRQHGFDWPPCLQKSEVPEHCSEREMELMKFQKLMLEREMESQPQTSTLTLAFDSSQSVDRVPHAWHGLPCWCPHSKMHLYFVSRHDDMLAFDRRRILPAEALQLQGAVFLFNILFFRFRKCRN